MKQTTNYALNKLELADSPPDITAINPNWDTIDTTLKNLDNTKAPKSHVTAWASETGLGHVSLSDSVVSMDDVTSGTAATPKAVKTAYDRAETALTNASNAQTTANSAQDTANGKVSKSGDTMTGTLTMAADTRIQGQATDNRLFLAASPNAPLGGATLELCAEEHPQPGVFYLKANQDNEQQYLVGKPNGELKWNSQHIVRSINNVNADANGNINIDVSASGDYLPLTGGAMTAAIAMTRNLNDDALQLHGGTDKDSGAGLWLYGKDKTGGLPGSFRMRATANGENTDLIGHANGNLLWNGNSMHRLSYPDYSAQMTLTFTNLLYTAPNDGYYYFTFTCNNSNGLILFVNNKEVGRFANNSGSNVTMSYFGPISKNEVLRIMNHNSGVIMHLGHFYPCIGV